jgi:5-methylcytosine-specific restriction protein B
MTKLPVSAVLWKKATETNFKALNGELRGEFDFRLGTDPSFREFFSSLAQESPTALGGYNHSVPIEPFTGPNSVPARTIVLRYMGPSAARANDTYFASQQPSATYDLWRKGRSFPDGAVYGDVEGDRVLVVRDGNGGFHARWLRRDDIAALPQPIRDAIQNEERGVLEIDTSGGPTVPPDATRVHEALLKHYNVLLYGPPATGKTHLVQTVIDSFTRSTIVIDTDAEGKSLSRAGANVLVRWATFHQSYSYEDFVVGLRPDPSSTGSLKLDAIPGVLLELTEWARVPGNVGLLVIDEINRGNVSRIFGEFITLMEADKRLDDAGNRTSRTIEVRLPYIRPGTPVDVDYGGGHKASVPTPFTMPLNVFTLATMNSVDKSVAPLDAALRRRFYLLNLDPELGEMATRMGLTGFDPDAPLVLPNPIANGKDIKRLTVAAVARMNTAIAQFLGPEFRLGQWYLEALLASSDDLADARAATAALWEHDLLPQLEELFHGRVEQLIALLDLKDSLVQRPDAPLEELGATPVLTGVHGLAPEDVIALLRRTAKVTLPPVTP